MSIKSGLTVGLPEIDSWRESAHRFDDDQVLALEASRLSGRPLLVRGEPGLGKSQIARAFATFNKWRLITTVVNARTEIEDLLYSIDHVSRLSDANQVVLREGLARVSTASDEIEDLSEPLAIQGYIHRGPVWNALEPIVDSKDNRPGDPREGTVLLVDEIDKAHPDVPNALLEVLNSMSFTVPQTGETITGRRDKLFVVITANDERPLPSAFLRRCAVLTLSLGSEPEKRLVNIARAHRDAGLLSAIDDEGIFEKAAEITVTYRNGITAPHYRPGTSEFLDLLRVVNAKLASETMSEADIDTIMSKMSTFLIQKDFYSDDGD